MNWANILRPPSAIGGVGAVDVLKLDCEGAEFPILADASPATLAVVRTIVAELHAPISDPATMAAMGMAATLASSSGTPAASGHARNSLTARHGIKGPAQLGMVRDTIADFFDAPGVLFGLL